MKKNIPFQMAFIAMWQWLVFYQANAQSEWFSPLQWESLIQDQQKNLIIRDTVLYQGFDSDNPRTINYTVSGKYDFFYPQEEGIQGASDSRAIRLYPGSRLTIDTLIYPALKMAEIHIPFAFQHVNKEEDIYFTLISIRVIPNLMLVHMLLKVMTVLGISGRYMLVDNVSTEVEGLIPTGFKSKLQNRLRQVMVITA